MTPLSPHPGVTAGFGDDDRPRRLRLRLTQVAAAAVTVAVTAWLCSLGVWPAILALVTAKHVLVAIFLMDTGIHAAGR